MRVFICLAAIAALFGCAGTGGEKEAAFDPEQQEAKIACRASETFAVAIPSNPTTGYGWTAILPDGIELLGKKYIPNKNKGGLCGAGGMERLEFASRSKGEFKIKLEYRRPWEKNSAPADSKILKVTIN